MMIQDDVISVSCASTTRGDFPLKEILTTNERSWWISADGSFELGYGREWLEFSFGGLKRISYIGIRIPPMPQGPLSVREFVLHVPSSQVRWTCRCFVNDALLAPPCTSESLSPVFSHAQAYEDAHTHSITYTHAHFVY